MLPEPSLLRCVRVSFEDGGGGQNDREERACVPVGPSGLQPGDLQAVGAFRRAGGRRASSVRANPPGLLPLPGSVVREFPDVRRHHSVGDDRTVPGISELPVRCSLFVGDHSNHRIVHGARHREQTHHR